MSSGSCDCVLRCNMCQICIHSYKCTCMNNVIHFNICKHIHACAPKLFQTPLTQNLNSTSKKTLNNVPSIFPCLLENRLIEINEGKENKYSNKQKQIEHKMEVILGMSKRTALNNAHQDDVLKYCDKILDILSKNNNMNFKKSSNLKRKIEPQARFMTNKKSKTTERQNNILCLQLKNSSLEMQ